MACVVTDGPGYRVDTTIDSAGFQQLLDTTRLGAGRLADLDAALLLWHGDAMDEFCHEPWVRAEAARLNELRLIPAEGRAELLIALGRSDEAVAGLEAHIAAHPHRDRPRALLMQALAVEGRRAEALRTFQDYRTFRAEETGTEPSASINNIEQRVVMGDIDEQHEVIAALTNAGYWSPDPLTPITAASPPPVNLPTGVVTFLVTDVEGPQRPGPISSTRSAGRGVTDGSPLPGRSVRPSGPRLSAMDPA